MLQIFHVGRESEAGGRELCRGEGQGGQGGGVGRQGLHLNQHLYTVNHEPNSNKYSLIDCSD